MHQRREGLRFHCPDCGEALLQVRCGFNCVGCGKDYEVLGDIPRLVKNGDYYYGEVSRSEMQELVTSCEKEHWSGAFRRLLLRRRNAQFLEYYALSPGRAAWWPLLGFYPEGRVLDLGCGWGTIAFSLAPHMGEVVACDLCLERLLFLKARASQDGFSNIRFVWAGDSPRLPFGNAEFDLVIMNGVLEWVPTTSEGDPSQIQQRFLKEAARVLQKDGQLLLGIENRFAWDYFRGRPEDHSSIPYVSLLPRRLADSYAAMVYGKSYRTYTYSYWGYKSLFRNAGFQSSKALVPKPGYRKFDTLIDPLQPSMAEQYYADNASGPNDTLKSRIKAHLNWLLAPGYCWIANRGSTQPSFLVALVCDFAKKVYGLKTNEFRWLSYRVTDTNSVAASVQIDQTLPPVLIKLPLDKFAEHRCELEHLNLKKLWQSLPQSGGWEEIPKPLAAGQWCGRKYFAQSFRPGIKSSRFLHSGSDKHQWEEAALAFLIKLHTATRQPLIMDEPLWESMIQRAVDPALIFYERLGVRRQRVEAYLRKHLVGKTWPVVFSHGDYWHGNLLVDSATGRITGVLDWDKASPHCLPCLDMIHLLSYQRKITARERTAFECFVDLSSREADDFDPAMNKYVEAMGMTVTTDEMRALCVLYWLRMVAVRLPPCDAARNVSNTSWQESLAETGRWLRGRVSECDGGKC